jgi:hypothetical protein
MQFYCRAYLTYNDKCSMNLRCKIMVVSVATLREAHPERSTPEVKDQCQMIPLRRKLVIQKVLLAAGPVPILAEKQKKQKTSKSHKFEEFRKAKPPSFDGEIKKGEEAEAWLLGLKKYFRVHDFSENLKARVATFNLNGKASIWWEDLKNMKRGP